MTSNIDHLRDLLIDWGELAFEMTEDELVILKEEINTFLLGLGGFEEKMSAVYYNKILESCKINAGKPYGRDQFIKNELNFMLEQEGLAIDNL